MKNKFNQQDSFETIQTMIDNAKIKFKEKGELFILWGWHFIFLFFYISFGYFWANKLGFCNSNFYCNFWNGEFYNRRNFKV